MLRDGGAKEVHLRVSSPPYRWPCFYGMDTGSKGQLLAANLTVDEIQRYLEVDSLSYLQLEELINATGTMGSGFCDACLTGEYPIEIPKELSSKLNSEESEDQNLVSNDFFQLLEQQTRDSGRS
jgi:amidophosphoribosyltransferase